MDSRHQRHPRVSALIARLAPVIPLGCVRPVGLSRTGQGGWILRVPLPFRWKDYSYISDRITWGDAVLFWASSNWQGKSRVVIYWIPDESPTIF